MVIRHYIECTTCHAPYTLRISVGHGMWQEHNFHCLQCEEVIRIGMEVDYHNIRTYIRCLENCSDGNREGTIVNLSPERPVDSKILHEDFVFPFVTDPLLWSTIEAFKNKPDSEVELLRKKQMPFTDPSDEWKLLKKAWSLYNNNKSSLLVDMLRIKFNKKDVQEKDFLQWLYDFCVVICGKRGRVKFNNVSSFIDDVRQCNFPLYKEFTTYFYANIHSKNFPSYLDIFSDYFAGYSEFNQVALYTQADITIPADFTVTSTSFKKNKMFYGNAYELLTSNIVLIALLNNVAKGRRFDQFAEMDLNKYRTINKANRCNPFKDVPELAALCEPLDSTLRNASHHGAIKYDHGSRTVSYRSGGTGAEHKMTYMSYLEKCVDIMISICALLMIEIVYLYAKSDNNGKE